MTEKLHWHTTTESVRKILPELMEISELKQFRLVGGTALSLQLGHRQSVDIDLFTDSEYGAVDFRKIDAVLRKIYCCVDTNSALENVPVMMYFIGKTSEALIKLDLFYTDPFIFQAVGTDGIRMATMAETGTMKLELISRGGRKKDFWDILEISDHMPFLDLVSLSLQKYPYLTKKALKKGLKDFSLADDEVNPRCLRGRYWELVKADMVELADQI